MVEVRDKLIVIRFLMDENPAIAKKLLTNLIKDMKK